MEKNEHAATGNGESEATDEKGATIALNESQFGPMLVDSRKQAIYIFENDPEGKTVCYGECAKAWPPVLTKLRPVRERERGCGTRCWAP